MTSLFSNWKALLGICLIFVLGCAAGALVDRALVARKIRQLIENPEEMQQVVQRRLTYDLSLDKAQQAQLRVILADAAQQLKDARKPIQPEVRAIILDARKKTEAILTPAQEARFQQDLERAKRRFPHIQFMTMSGPNAAPPAAPAPASAPANP